MNGIANNGCGLDALRQPITVDGTTVTLHFESASASDKDLKSRLDAIREILLAAYHAD